LIYRRHDSVAWTFEHEKSGARLFFLQNDDDNKVFSITFRTPPVDDTGVAHIVEHSTLCGSRKYPLKEPFVELVKGSLNTFLNAMTYPDKTMYPVASRNDKDFQNLMDVYLDAVFYPSMRENPQVLMQEGWHYEIESPDEPLTYSGVVYNEMKGALSAPDDLLESRIMASLYPDTTYGMSRAVIRRQSRSLRRSSSWRSIAAITIRPTAISICMGIWISRVSWRIWMRNICRISTGSRFRRRLTVSRLFRRLVRRSESYPVSADEDTAEKTFLSLNWVTGDSLDARDMMGLEILEHALLRTAAAPLRKVLIDAQLGKDVDSSFEDDLLQPYFSIVINNAEADRAEKFYTLVMDTLRKLADEGLDRTLMEASINLLEFRLRESDFGSAPKGLIYGIRIMKTWLYDGEPETYLGYESVLKEMKAGLDTGYFEDLIRRLFLNNTHRTLLTLAPSKTMAAEREAEQEKLLAKKKAAMSPARSSRSLRRRRH
jgi:Zn-dependent M16 (insulinase) family peptidase